jgi:hypothetical protein
MNNSESGEFSIYAIFISLKTTFNRQIYKKYMHSDQIADTGKKAQVWKSTNFGAGLYYIITFSETCLFLIYRNLVLTKDHRNIYVNKSVDKNFTLQRGFRRLTAKNGGYKMKAFFFLIVLFSACIISSRVFCADQKAVVIPLFDQKVVVIPLFETVSVAKVSCRDVDWNCTPGVGNSCSFDKDSCCAEYGATDCDSLFRSCKDWSEIGCYGMGYCKAKENACMNISGALSE